MTGGDQVALVGIIWYYTRYFLDKTGRFLVRCDCIAKMEVLRPLAFETKTDLATRACFPGERGALLGLRSTAQRLHLLE